MHIASIIFFSFVIALALAVITASIRRALRHRAVIRRRLAEIGQLPPRKEYDKDGNPFIVSGREVEGDTHFRFMPEVTSEHDINDRLAPSDLWPTRHADLDSIDEIHDWLEGDGEAPQKVSEICGLCDVVGGHADDCPDLILCEIADARTEAWHSPESRAALARAGYEIVEDDGEPLAQPPQPNIGGDGNPPYRGPNYVEPHEIVDEMKSLRHYGTDKEA